MVVGRVFALAVRTPADQGANFAGFRIERDECRLYVRIPSPAAVGCNAPFRFCHARSHRIRGGGLKLGIQSRINAKRPMANVDTWKCRLQLGRDHVGKMRRFSRVGIASGDCQWIPGSRLVVAIRNKPVSAHQRQHDIAALSESLWRAKGGISIRATDHARQRRCFGKIDSAELFVKVIR